MTSFESVLLATASPVDADDVLSTIAHAPIADFLPAEQREDRPRAQGRSSTAMDEDDNDDDENEDDDKEDGYEEAHRSFEHMPELPGTRVTRCPLPQRESKGQRRHTPAEYVLRCRTRSNAEDAHLNRLASALAVQ